MSEPVEAAGQSGQPSCAPSTPTNEPLLLASYVAAMTAYEQAASEAEQAVALTTARTLWGALARVRGQRLLT